MPIRRVDTTEIEYNSGSNTYTLPTTRGADTYVLTRDNTIGTGGTTWKETITPPVVSSVTYPTQNGVQATALAATGAQDTTAETLLINGSNFTSTVTVNISGNGVSSSAFAGTFSVNTAGTVITCSNVTKQAAADNYTLTVNNSTGMNATITVNFSADPSFSTASGSLGTVYVGTAMSTKTITAGSSVSWYEGTPTMPTWMTHFVDGATGTSQDLTGTPTNSGTSEVQNFNIIIRDSENQSHNRDFSLIVADFPTGGATGGTGSPASGAFARYTDGGVTYQVHKFTTTGSSNFINYANMTADILIIGGGGGAGSSYSGGGGAGQVIWGTGVTITAGTHTVSVGTGGATGANTGGQNNLTNLGQNGGSSSFVMNAGSTQTYTAGGGGGGGSYEHLLSAYSPLASVGSTGGTSIDVSGNNTTAQTPSGTAPSGGNVTGTWNSYVNSGGNGSYNSATGTTGARGSAGGGGAGAAATANISSSGTSSEMSGGVGITALGSLNATATTAFLLAAQAGTDSSNTATTSSSSGTLYIAAGGAGGHENGNNGSGGLGGGGSAAQSSAGQNGRANTGSGGGGHVGYNISGGTGGSGIVIIRYAIS